MVMQNIGSVVKSDIIIRGHTIHSSARVLCGTNRL
jgi:hypothetical protein